MPPMLGTAPKRLARVPVGTGGGGGSGFPRMHLAPVVELLGELSVVPVVMFPGSTGRHGHHFVPTLSGPGALGSRRWIEG